MNGPPPGDRVAPDDLPAAAFDDRVRAALRAWLDQRTDAAAFDLGRVCEIVREDHREPDGFAWSAAAVYDFTIDAVHDDLNDDERAACHRLHTQLCPDCDAPE